MIIKGALFQRFTTSLLGLMINLIVDLPRGLTAFILSNFLTSSSILRLDQAFCVATGRAFFLELLSSFEYKLKERTHLFEFPCAHERDIALIRWCMLRSIRLDILQWVSEISKVDSALLTKFANLAYSSIEQLSIEARDFELPLIVDHYLNLSCLKVLHWHIPFSPDGSELLAILARAPLLENLLFSKLQFGNNIETKSIHCPNVRHLFVRGNWRGNYSNWLGPLFPNTREVHWNVEGSIDASKDVICSFPLLQRLVYRRYMTDTALCSLADACPLLVSAHIYNARAVTDAGLEYLCSKCIKLESILIWTNSHITSVALQSMSRHLAATLKEINVARCSGIRSYASLRGCINLQCIRAFSNEMQHLDVLFKACPSIREVCLNNITGICEYDLVALAQHCPQLQRLLVDPCRYPQPLLPALATHSHNLKSLRVGNSKVSAEFRAHMKSIGCELVCGDDDDGGSSSVQQ